jgi:hypothetical protein
VPLADRPRMAVSVLAEVRKLADRDAASGHPEPPLSAMPVPYRVPHPSRGRR